MVTSCHIVIHPSKDGVFRPGEIVNGSVVYSLRKETEFKDIILVLVGRGSCTWREISYSPIFGDDKTYRGAEQIVKTEISLLKKEKNATVKLSEGAYDHNFNVALPENIPPTYSDNFSNIKYYIKVKFVKPGIFSFKEKFVSELVVKNLIDDGTELQQKSKRTIELEKKIFRLLERKNNKINVKVDVSKTLLKPGDLMKTVIEILNTTHLDVFKTNQLAFRRVTYTATCGKKKTVNQLIAKIKLGKVLGNSFEKKTTDLMITESYHTIRNSNILSVEFYQKIIIKLPAPHRNVTLKIPFTVGVWKDQIVTSEVSELQTLMRKDIIIEDKKEIQYNDFLVDVDEKKSMIDNS